MYDFVMSAPIQQSVPMVEFIRIRNGRISDIRLLFDTAAFEMPSAEAA